MLLIGAKLRLLSTATESGCVECSRNTLQFEGKQKTAYQWAWLCHENKTSLPISELTGQSMVIKHICWNKKCVLFDHLKLSHTRNGEHIPVPPGTSDVEIFKYRFAATRHQKTTKGKVSAARHRQSDKGKATKSRYTVSQGPSYRAKVGQEYGRQAEHLPKA